MNADYYYDGMYLRYVPSSAYCSPPLGIGLNHGYFVRSSTCRIHILSTVFPRASLHMSRGRPALRLSSQSLNTRTDFSIGYWFFDSYDQSTGTSASYSTSYVVEFGFPSTNIIFRRNSEHSSTIHKERLMFFVCNMRILRFCSARGMFAETHCDDCYVIIRKRAAAILRRIWNSTNGILKVIRDKPAYSLIGIRSQSI